MTAAMSGLEPQPFPTPPASSTTTTLPDIPEEAIVPPLLGQDATEEFIAALQGEPDYWVIQRVDIETRGYTPELIIRQSPKAGEIVPGGSIITIEVAVPPEVFPVPPVVGLSEAEARTALENANFEVAVVTAANPDGGDSPPAGIVWAQDPAPGEEDADIITVTISVNPTPPPPDDGDGSGDGGDS
jgi:serine/threonine-protein kinase